MLETPHVVVGAAIATKIANPALALPLAFGSHFILEKIPHWNPHLNTEKSKFGKITKSTTKIVLADSATALILGSFIASQALKSHTVCLSIHRLGVYRKSRVIFRFADRLSILTLDRSHFK